VHQSRDKRIVRTKEEADHSLPYMLAAALVDGRVQPEQYAQERIQAADVQDLLRKVTVVPVAALSALFPQRLPARLEVELDDGEILYRDNLDGSVAANRLANLAVAAGR
jgi:2-methylcitrate dehydratase